MPCSAAAFFALSRHATGFVAHRLDRRPAPVHAVVDEVARDDALASHAQHLRNPRGFLGEELVLRRAKDVDQLAVGVFPLAEGFRSPASRRSTVF